MPNRGKVPVLVTYLTLGFSLSDKHFCLGLNRTAGGVTLSADYDKGKVTAMFFLILKIILKMGKTRCNFLKSL